MGFMGRDPPIRKATMLIRNRRPFAFVRVLGGLVVLASPAQAASPDATASITKDSLSEDAPPAPKPEPPVQRGAASVDSTLLEPNTVEPNTVAPNTVGPAAVNPKGTEPGLNNPTPTAPPTNGEDATQTSPAVPSVENAAAPANAPPQALTRPELLTAPEYSHPAPRESRTIFSRNSFSLGVRFGWASTSEQTWGLLGAGLGYYALDGLEARVDADLWLGSPNIAVLTPAFRYVFHRLPDVKPFLGPLYRRYFSLEGGIASDAVGARLGVIFMLGEAIYAQGGALYEHVLDKNLFEKSDAVYPEIGIGYGF